LEITLMSITSAPLPYLLVPAHHPLYRGFRITSVNGEKCDDGEGTLLETDEYADGVVHAARHLSNGSGWSYEVFFEESGVSVYLDDADFKANPDGYAPAGALPGVFLHPLDLNTPIVALKGVVDNVDAEEAVGRVIAAERATDSEEWHYHVEFPGHGQILSLREKDLATPDYALFSPSEPLKDGEVDRATTGRPVRSRVRV
jgi:hypothetical protein